MSFALAAVVFEPDMPVDAVIAEALADPAIGGHRVIGYLQGYEPARDCDCSDIVLTALHDGSRRRITQDLGAGSTGCRLDSAALAEVAGWVEAEMTHLPDLLVVNRFGKVEAEGGGFRSTLERALAQEVPVLLAVSTKQLAFWRDWSGDLAQDLPCAVAPVRAFVHAACGIGNAAPAAQEAIESRPDECL